MMNFNQFNTVGMIVSALLGLGSLAQVAADSKNNGQSAEAKHVHQEVNPPMHGTARLLPTQDSKAHGMLSLTQTSAGLQIKGQVEGLEPGLHGFHIHEFGDLTDPQGKSAGGHFNPLNQPHGAPNSEHRHVGDLGNIIAGKDGIAVVNMNVPGLKLHFIVGRSFVVHAGEDDLQSQPSGDAGDRIAVGVIGIAQSKEKTKE